MTTKVWVVTDCRNHEVNVVGVYSSEKLAEEAVKRVWDTYRAGAYAEPIEVDAFYGSIKEE